MRRAIAAAFAFATGLAVRMAAAAPAEPQVALPKGWRKDAFFRDLWLVAGESIGTLTTAAVLLGVVALIKRRIGAGERFRLRLCTVLLGFSLAAWPIGALLLSGGHRSGYRNVQFAARLALAIAAVEVLAHVVFDILLPRARVRAPRIVRDLISVAMLFLVGMVVLGTAGVNLLSLVTTSAVLTAVIGLALQDTLGNFLSGLALQAEGGIAVGDWVEVSGLIGRVLEMRWRSVHIRTRSGDLVIVPNGSVARSSIVNFSRPSTTHRRQVSVGVHYRHPPNEVRAALLAAAREVPGVAEDPAVDCLVKEYGNDQIVYSLRFWIDDYTRYEEIDGEVRARIWYALKRRGMEIPFPIRNVFVARQNAVAEAEGRQEGERRQAALAGVEILRLLAVEERGSLAGRLRREWFAAGETILRQGDPGDSLYVLGSGRVSVRLAAHGAEREVAVLGVGECFGEMCLLTGEPRAATVVATADADCYVIDKAAFRDVLAGHAGLVAALGELLARRRQSLAAEREGLRAQAAGAPSEAEARQIVSRIRAFFGLS